MHRLLCFLTALLLVSGCSDSDGAPADPGPTADSGLDVVEETSEDVGIEASDDVLEAEPPETWSHAGTSVVEHAGALWNVELRDEEVVAVHSGGRVELVLDTTSSAADGRYAGIFLHVDGEERHVGQYNGSHVSMFVPDRPWKDQDSVQIVAQGEDLTIEMLEGNLSEIPDAQFESDEPFRWASRWAVEGQGLAIESHGLYYLLPPMDGCSVMAHGAGGVLLGTEQIDGDTKPFLRYYEGVRTISLQSPSLGAVSIETDAAVLQVQVPTFQKTTRFELDFDHSFKDHGQTDVMTRWVLPI
jgi:hypothetical protein